MNNNRLNNKKKRTVWFNSGCMRPASSLRMLGFFGA